MNDLAPLRLDDDLRVLVLTGAGVSAESGIATFRDSNGLWEQHRVEDVASPEGFARDPALVWRFYSLRREAAAKCAPNPGHAALAALEDRLGDRFLLATQNIDGLHGVAGNTRVVEMHGNLYTTRCSGCDRRPFRDDSLHPDAVPRCDRCGSMLRPHIVWFGERLDPADLQRIEDFIRAARGHRMVFLAAGTSGVVYPAAGLVDVCRRAGAETVLVNLEAPDNVGAFDRVITGRSGEVLPALFV
ncbi:MAG: NAD-dependent deacetylase [Myxococcaceae bacterium]|nr:NAD-dependent deacetylase [Myxococcaceae bacterium]